MAGVGSVPSDEVLESITLQAYRDFNKSSAQSITKSEFTGWIVTFASGPRISDGGRTKEVSLQAAMEQFGVVSAPVSSTADENNHETYEDHVGTNVEQPTVFSHIQDTHDVEASDAYSHDVEQFDASDVRQHHSIAEETVGDDYEDEQYESSKNHNDALADEYELKAEAVSPELTISDAIDIEDRQNDSENESGADHHEQYPSESNSHLTVALEDEGVSALPVGISESNFSEGEVFAEYEPPTIKIVASDGNNGIGIAEAVDKTQQVESVPLANEEVESYDDAFDGEGDMSARYDDDAYDAEQQEDAYDTSNVAEEGQEHDTEVVAESGANAGSLLPETNPEDTQPRVLEAQEESVSSEEHAVNKEEVATNEEVTSSINPLTSEELVSENNVPMVVSEKSRSDEQPVGDDDHPANEIAVENSDGETPANEEPAINDELPTTGEPTLNDEVVSVDAPAVMEEPTTSKDSLSNDESVQREGLAAREELVTEEQFAGSEEPAMSGDFVPSAESEPTDEPIETVDPTTPVDELSPRYDNEEEEKQVIHSDEVSPEGTPNTVDVNAFDTYDYEDAEFDSSSGLPPPEPTSEELFGEESPTQPDELVSSLDDIPSK